MPAPRSTFPKATRQMHTPVVANHVVSSVEKELQKQLVIIVIGIIVIIEQQPTYIHCLAAQPLGQKLWRHVRCRAKRFGLDHRLLHHTAQTEICHLGNESPRVTVAADQQDVVSREVTVQDIESVAVTHGRSYFQGCAEDMLTNRGTCMPAMWAPEYSLLHRILGTEYGACALH